MASKFNFPKSAFHADVAVALGVGRRRFSESSAWGMMCTCGLGNVVAMCTCGCGGGAMLTRHSRAPVGLRVLVRICLPELSWTSRQCLSMNAVQPALHSLPRLRRSFVKSGMICPIRALMVGMAGIANCDVGMDVLASPVAVRMVVRGAKWSRLRIGVVSMK